MKTSKHLALAALLVVAMALVTSTSALAQSTITLTNVADPTDRDTGASGEATLTDVAYSHSYSEYQAYAYMTEYDIYTGYLAVRCSGLTPRATYSIGSGWTGRASDTGTLELSVKVSFVGGATYWSWYSPGGAFWNGWWVRDWSWHDESYGFSVARKKGKGYIEVLQGYFPEP